MAFQLRGMEDEGGGPGECGVSRGQCMGSVLSGVGLSWPS